MKDVAKNQYKPITVSNIKAVLEARIPDVYSKMLIADNAEIKRTNFVFVHLKYRKVERKLQKLKFPLYPNLVEAFAQLTAADKTPEDKQRFVSEDIFEQLKNQYLAEPISVIDTDVAAPFDFPLDIENYELKKNQPKYYFTKYTASQTCDLCHGHKYVNCPDDNCKTRHVWECDTCGGNGILECDTCGGKRKVACNACNGTTRTRCRVCNGDGKLFDKLASKKAVSKYIKHVTCFECGGKGSVPCKACKDGTENCTDCKGIGKTICPDCQAKGKITCFRCYGEGDKRGKISCPQCQTEGTTGTILYVNTIVSDCEKEGFFADDSQMFVSEKILAAHIPKERTFETVMKRLNAELVEKHTDLSAKYAAYIEKYLNVFKGTYPMLAREDLYFRVIPCTEISFKHILTGTEHELLIVDFFENPEIIFRSEPELLKIDKKTAGQSVHTFFGKVFKTKSYKTKRDKFLEIALLIYLAKADNMVNQAEKLKLAQLISGFDAFTYKEKQALFNLMSAQTLPELTKNDVRFSTKTSADQVLHKLEKLAAADNDFCESERALIDKVAKLMNPN